MGERFRRMKATGGTISPLEMKEVGTRTKTKNRGEEKLRKTKKESENYGTKGHRDGIMTKTPEKLKGGTLPTMKRGQARKGREQRYAFTMGGGPVDLEPLKGRLVRRSVFVKSLERKVPKKPKIN